MTISQKKCTESALRNGVDTYHMFRETDISNEFKLFNKEVWDSPRCSYWIWKAYIIYDTFCRRCNDGDILIYADSGLEFIDSVDHIISRMGKDFFFFSNGWYHHHWCKGCVSEAINPFDAYEIAKECDGKDIGSYFDAENEYRSKAQIQASLLFFRVTDDTRKFVKEWLLWCQFPGFIDDTPSKNNSPEFQEHRHDQAILTCCAIKHNIDYNHLWPDILWQNQRHRWLDDTYPAIIKHHRKRNSEW